MRLPKIRLLLALFLLSVGNLPAVLADEIRVAVASNFVETLRAITRSFEEQSGHRVILIPGSTGKHYAQISHGAPFDAFFAADSHRPERLDREGKIRPGSRFTYAVGHLVLWSPLSGYVDPEGAVLERGKFSHLAIANPKLAPYGRAAREVLERRGLWEALAGRMVRGENIGQAFHFVESGNAPLGFVASSQITHPGRPIPGSCWVIPHSLYTPIEQQAVQISASAATGQFMAFVRTPEAREIIHGFGYSTPETR